MFFFIINVTPRKWENRKRPPFSPILRCFGNGLQESITMLPEAIIKELQRHVEYVKLLHAQDLQEGFGSVELPQALERKYRNAAMEWAW
ncbi:MAG TPA: hypothetical protein PL181_05770 [bacterium]|nr:hypothetical protein [bacterium]